MAAEVDQWALKALKEKLPALLEEGRANGHDVDADPYLQLDQTHLCRRYLIATDSNVAEAAERIKATIAFRRDWRVLDYHRPGVAQQLFSDVTNPGAEMYFGPSGHVDRLGRPYAVGRVYYANSCNMHPWRHLRAGLMVIERMAVDVLRRGCGYGSYILDIGEVPSPGTVSGTGGGGGHKPQEAGNPYYKRGAGREAPACLLRQFGEPGGGMAVLRVALTVANLYYPELISRVVVLNSNWLFGAAFRVFSLWVHRRTREKFVFVGGGWTNPPVRKLLEWYAPEELPAEWGGTGWRLDGDAFIAAGVKALDTDPALPQGCWESGFAGLDERERALAEEDAKARAAERGQTLALDTLKVGSPTRASSDGASSSSSSSSQQRPDRACCAPCFARPRAQDKRRRSASTHPAVLGSSGPGAGALAPAPGHRGSEGPLRAEVQTPLAASRFLPQKPQDWRVIAALTMLFAASVLNYVLRAAGNT